MRTHSKSHTYRAEPKMSVLGVRQRRGAKLCAMYLLLSLGYSLASLRSHGGAPSTLDKTAAKFNTAPQRMHLCCSSTACTLYCYWRAFASNTVQQASFGTSRRSHSPISCAHHGGLGLDLRSSYKIEESDALLFKAPTWQSDAIEVLNKRVDE